MPQKNPVELKKFEMYATARYRQHGLFQNIDYVFDLSRMLRSLLAALQCPSMGSQIAQCSKESRCLMTHSLSSGLYYVAGESDLLVCGGRPGFLLLSLSRHSWCFNLESLFSSPAVVQILSVCGRCEFMSPLRIEQQIVIDFQNRYSISTWETLVCNPHVITGPHNVSACVDPLFPPTDFQSSLFFCDVQICFYELLGKMMMVRPICGNELQGYIMEL